MYIHIIISQHVYIHIIYSRFKKYIEDYNPGDEPTLYAYWAASVIGPVVHGLALIYALMFYNKVITLIGRIIGTIVYLQHFVLLVANIM